MNTRHGSQTKFLSKNRIKYLINTNLFCQFKLFNFGFFFIEKPLSFEIFNFCFGVSLSCYLLSKESDPTRVCLSHERNKTLISFKFLPTCTTILGHVFCLNFFHKPNHLSTSYYNTHPAICRQFLLKTIF